MMVGEMPHHQPGQVSRSVLIDMIVQRTYHELTILAELLPRKTDMERKIEIFNFASRTRMLFIRLNALVKWASSASKVKFPLVLSITLVTFLADPDDFCPYSDPT